MKWENTDFHRLRASKLMQNLVRSSDTIQLWAAKIKWGWVKQHSVEKLGSILPTYLTWKLEVGLKGKPKGNSEVGFFTVHWSGFGRYVPVTRSGNCFIPIQTRADEAQSSPECQHYSQTTIP